MQSKFAGVNEKLFSSKEISGIGTVRVMRLLRGRVTKFLNFVGRSLSYTSARSYGCFFLSFGIMSLLLNLGEYYFKSEPQVHLSSLIIGMIFAAVAIPLIFFDKPMCVALQDFPLTDYLFFEFLSIKRMHKNTEHPTIPPLIAIFLGFIPAVAGFFLPIEWVVISIALTVLVTVSFTSPEFPMILTILSLPYLSLLPYPIIILSSLSVLAFLSYALKVVLGKRAFNLDIYSVLIFILMLCVFASGIAGYGSDSLRQSLIFIMLMLGYFPAANVIINRRLADCAINAVIASAVPITVISMIEFIVELPGTPYNIPTYSTPGISATFSSPFALSVFILISAILTLVFAIQKKHRAKKIFYYTVFVLDILVLGIIMQPEIWFAALLTMLAYPILKFRKAPLEILLVLAAVPYLILLLPGDILDTVSGYFGNSVRFSETISGYKEAIGVFLDNIWLGTGIGEESHMIASGTDFTGAFNTAVGVAAELGILVSLCLVLVLLVRIRHLSYYRMYMRISLVGVIGNMTALATVAVLIVGAFGYVFSDTSLLYLFWSVFGICTSSLRTAKREFDDRMEYYGDSSSYDATALDVSVNN